MSLVDEARAAVAEHAAGEVLSFFAASPDLVARLADALEAAERELLDKRSHIDTLYTVGQRTADERDEAQRWAAWFAAESDEWQGRAGTLAGWLYAARGDRADKAAEMDAATAAEADRDEALQQLAEARAAIARVEALCDNLEADGEGGPVQAVTRAIATGVRRALRGEQG